MLEKKLQSFIPKILNDFPKINRVGDPYYFLKWDIDKKGQKPILRYWFWNKGKNFQNKKRLFINEFEDLLRLSLKFDGFDRSDYIKVCPKSYSDGDCGFAVIIGILEYFQLITKIELGRYSLSNKEEIKDMLN